MVPEPITPSAVAMPGGVPGVLAPVSIAEILERQVALEWFECVAIVSGICAAVGDGAGELVPDRHDCLLTPEGTIHVRDGARPHLGVEELPRLLHALLDGSKPPAPLRLFVVHAIESDTYRSVKAFREALAYYERPDRTALLQSAYQRYLETPVPVRPPEPPPIPEPRKPVVNADAETKRASTRGKRMWIALGATLLCAAAALVTVAVGMGPSRFDAPDALATLAARAGDIATAAGEALGWGADRETPPVGKADPEPPQRRPTTRRAASRPVPAPLELIPAIESGPTFEPAAIVEKEPSVPAAPEPEAAAVRFDDAEPIVYTSDAPDVEPPVLLYPSRLPAAVRAADGKTAAAMELIVSENGTVASARFLTPPERMTDIMLLSAAKTWLFRPGMKDGRPVPYRVVTDWSSLR